MKKITYSAISLIFLISVFGLANHLVFASDAVSNGLNSTACSVDKSNPYCAVQSSGTSSDPLTNTISKVTTLAALAGGIIAVFFVIYGGFRYVISNGDSDKTASARNTIFYAVIGMVVIVAAQIIILFVIEHLK